MKKKVKKFYNFGRSGHFDRKINFEIVNFLKNNFIPDSLIFFLALTNSFIKNNANCSRYKYTYLEGRQRSLTAP